MVEYSGLVAAAAAAGGLTNVQPQGWIDGRVKCNVDKITLTGVELSGSTIIFGNNALPDGSTILAILMSSSTAQVSLTASIGDDGSATRYASASTGLQTANALTLLSGRGYVVTGTNDLQIVLTTGGATATAGVITLVILYTHD